MGCLVGDVMVVVVIELVEVGFYKEFIEDCVMNFVYIFCWRFCCVGIEYMLYGVLFEFYG